jgi:ribose/xylose/arabinose/galactoside ABC-type transport system permease subunit
MSNEAAGEVFTESKLVAASHFFNRFAIYFVLAALCLALSILSPDFLTPGNLVNVFIAEAGRGMLALGLGLVIISRGIDISVGSIVSLTSVVTACLVQEPTYTNRIFPQLGHVPVPIAVLAGLLTAVVMGTFNGWLVAYTLIPPMIATLGTLVIARGLALILTNAIPVPMLRADYKILGQGSLGPVPTIVAVFVVMAVVTWAILNHTRFGKNVYFIGGNVNAARVSGVKVERNLIYVYAFSGLCAGLAGVLITARAASGIATLGLNYEMDAIAAATIGGCSHTGGVGTAGGIVAGILILGILNNGLLLLGVSPYLQQVVKGVIIIGAVVVDMRKNRRK